VFAPGLALAGDIATQRDTGSKLSVLTMSFGLGTAIGPLAAGFFVRFGFLAPFAFGAGLGLIGLVLVYTQVAEPQPSEDPTVDDGTGSETVSPSD
jgi:MFS family permease